jgi:hypothetical protein
MTAREMLSDVVDKADEYHDLLLVGITTDGHMHMGWTSGMTVAERIGILELAKRDIARMASS